MAPVPPFATATIPVTLAALPVIFPDTLLPETAAIFSSVTELFAKSAVAMVPSKSLSEVTAPVAIKVTSPAPVVVISPVSVAGVWSVPLLTVTIPVPEGAGPVEPVGPVAPVNP